MRCIILFVYFLKIKTRYPPHIAVKFQKSHYPSFIWYRNSTYLTKIFKNTRQIFINLMLFSMYCCTKAVIVEKPVVFSR